VTDIAEFLTTRYAEDEAAAKACKPGPWMQGSERPHLVNGVIYGQSTGCPGGGHLEQVCMVNIDYAGQAGPANVLHMLRYDPARVLADIAADRLILKVCANQVRMGCSTARDVLLRLAAPYAEHPDFEPSWRVD
jgi:hypothetical protein